MAKFAFIESGRILTLGDKSYVFDLDGHICAAENVKPGDVVRLWFLETETASDADGTHRGRMTLKCREAVRVED